MKRLGVNIDHVATLRNARGEFHPDPLLAAKLAMKIGADLITVHLREDRRHINDKDLSKICSNKKIPIYGSLRTINELKDKYTFCFSQRHGYKPIMKANVVKNKFNIKKGKTNIKDANIKELEMSISDKLGLSVNISNKKNNKGKITFEYKDLDQLNRIIDILKINY